MAFTVGTRVAETKAKRRETVGHNYLAGVLNFALTILSGAAKYRVITKEN
jgi:hypothetical protein